MTARRDDSFRWKAVILAVMIAVASMAITACTPASRAADPLSTHAAGELLSQPVETDAYPALDPLASKAFKIRYRSTSGIDGSATSVSGVVFVPKRKPPWNGWPIVSIAHATTGVTTDCAPSAYPNLLGNLGDVIGGLSRGFMVVMSDLQGLGSPGLHPYMEPKTAAYNVIDAVRAARQTVSGTSNVWVAYGFSQGAQAAWAANELAPAYGSDLDLLGSVSIAPPTDLRPMVDAMENGTLTTDQKVLLPLVLKGVQAAHPELKFDDYLHGVLARRVDVFFACAGVLEDLKGLIAKSAGPGDYKPATKEAADQLRTWLGEFSVPIRHTDIPMLVGYGDADDIILPAWTAEGIREACAVGDTIEVHVLAGQGHSVRFPDRPVEWVNARLYGQPPENSCTTA